MLAESLRFVGVVSVRIVGSGEGVMGEVIEPLDRTWYHTQAYDKFIDKTAPLVLGKRNNAANNGSKVDVEFVLWPFTHIPTSASTSSVFGSLEIVPWALQVANKPIVTYNVPADKVKPAVPILGWRIEAEEIADIVLVNTLPGDDTIMPVYVSSAKTDQPQLARNYNAILRMVDITPGAETGTSIPVPPRYESVSSEPLKQG